MIGMCQWGMRQTAEIENQMTSVERVMEYANLPSEPPLESTAENKPPVEWPQNGTIQFQDLSFKYSANGEFVLRDITIDVKAGEKVGIVGRTGAGKSSIIQAMFRLAELDGVILIDGIDTNQLGLHDLRTKISIIPQDPVLFSGTLRFNLDPFDERTEEELWGALAQVCPNNLYFSLVWFKCFVSTSSGRIKTLCIGQHWWIGLQDVGRRIQLQHGSTTTGVSGSCHFAQQQNPDLRRGHRQRGSGNGSFDPDNDTRSFHKLHCVNDSTSFAYSDGQ